VRRAVRTAALALVLACAAACGGLGGGCLSVTEGTAVETGAGLAQAADAWPARGDVVVFEDPELAPEVLRPEGEPRGVVVYLRGLGSDSLPGAVAEEFVARGWLVIAVPETVAESEPIRVDVLELGMEQAARTVARGVDLRIAERVYVVEDELARLRADRPALAEAPLVLFGVSAGSLALPALAARLDGEVDAAVITVSGANIFDIAHTSVRTRAGLHVQWGDRGPRAGEYSRLSGLYLEASHLDPWVTAPALADVPVLLIQARLDMMVPARSGELLAERLGEPEVWRYAGGHVAAYMALPGMKADIADWVDRALGE
jgi:alpha-beta hydrolase superfamily lysophospholipase